MTILTTLLLIILAIVNLFVIMLFYWMIRGAPYAPSRQKAIDQMIEFAKATNAKKVADLGSGDGRVVIALAKEGIEADGYEINPLLVWISRRNIRKAGQQNLAHVYRKSFWKVDFASYDAAFIYPIGYILRSLGKKLKREMKTGSYIISNAFSFPDWKEEKKENGVYLYPVNKAEIDEKV